MITDSMGFFYPFPNLLDDDNFVIPGCMRCVTTQSLGCPSVQTPCVFVLYLAGRSHDLKRFHPGHFNYWLVERLVVWFTVVAYGVN